MDLAKSVKFAEIEEKISFFVKIWRYLAPNLVVNQNFFGNDQPTNQPTNQTDQPPNQTSQTNQLKNYLWSTTKFLPKFTNDEKCSSKFFRKMMEPPRTIFRQK